MALEILAVNNHRDLTRFIHFPYQLYRRCDYYVPGLKRHERNSLRRDKNPAFEFCDAQYWIAEKEGKIVGRIAGIIQNRHIEKTGEQIARFGWIDFVDDEEVSRALVTTVENWAAEKGITRIHGPLGFTDLDEEGMLVEGFQELGTLPMLYNFEYYPRHLERLGYVKDVDWIEFCIKVPEKLPERLKRIEHLIGSRTRLRLVKFKSRKQILSYAQGIFRVLNEAYAGLYGVTYLNEKQIQKYINQYFGFVNRDFVQVVVNPADEVVAFGIAMPSLSRAMRKAWGRLFPTGALHLIWALTHPRYIDLYLVAVRPDYQGRGVNSLLIAGMQRSCEKHGVISAESSGHLEDNTLVQAFWKHFECRQHKRRRIYTKQL